MTWPLRYIFLCCILLGIFGCKSTPDKEETPLSFSESTYSVHPNQVKKYLEEYYKRELTYYKYAEPHMGMIFRIGFYWDDPKTADLIAEKAFNRVNELNEIMSDYDPESELSRFVKTPAGEKVTLSNDLFDVLSISKKLAKETDGLFDPTIGTITQLWRKCRKSKTMPSESQIKQAKEFVGFQYLHLFSENHTASLEKNGIKLDLGGIGKGYTSNEVLKLLAKEGIFSAMVAASGDIAVSYPPPGESGWSIQIETMTENEDDKEAGTYIAFLKNQAISTSGDVNQFVEIDGKRYSHIVNPFTGLGLTHRIGATVIHTNATYSDAFATIVCLKGNKSGMNFINNHSPAQVRIGYLDNNGNRKYSCSKKFPTPSKK